MEKDPTGLWSDFFNKVAELGCTPSALLPRTRAYPPGKMAMSPGADPATYLRMVDNPIYGGAYA
jgi:hypothetical protein